MVMVALDASIAFPGPELPVAAVKAAHLMVVFHPIDVHAGVILQLVQLFLLMSAQMTVRYCPALNPADSKLLPSQLVGFKTCDLPGVNAAKDAPCLAGISFFDVSVCRPVRSMSPTAHVPV